MIPAQFNLNFNYIHNNTNHLLCVHFRQSRWLCYYLDRNQQFPKLQNFPGKEQTKVIHMIFLLLRTHIATYYYIAVLTCLTQSRTFSE